MTPLRDLAPREDRLLRFLLNHPYKRHKTSDLALEVWPEDVLNDQGEPYTPRGPADLQSVVYSLRKKIESNPHAPRHILTAHGIGYKLVE